MNFALPNKFTLARVLLITPIVICLYIGGPWYQALAALIFIIASITDYYDGYFARKLNLHTDFGKIFDHSADKGLITSVLVMFIYLKRVDPFLVIILVIRDILVNGIRISAANKVVIAAGKYGKFKTGLQMSAMPFLFVDPIFVNSDIYYWLHNVAYYVLWISVLFSVVSGLEYYRVWAKSCR